MAFKGYVDLVDAGKQAIFSAIAVVTMWQSKLFNFLPAMSQGGLHKAIASQFRNLLTSPKERVYSCVRRRMVPRGFATMLGMSFASWLVASAIAPQVAQAYTVRVNVSLNRKVNESYETMLRRAEAAAKAAAQRSFNKDRLVTDVAVIVLAENQGFIAPIMSLKATRLAWKRSPNPRRLATYFPHVKSLLGFTDTVTSPRQTGTATGAPASLPVFPGGTNTQPFPPGFPQNPTPGNASPVPQQPGTTRSGQPTPPGTITTPVPTSPATQQPGTTPSGQPTPPGTTPTPVPTSAPLVPPAVQTPGSPGTTTTP